MSYKQAMIEDHNKFHDIRNIREYFKTKSIKQIKDFCCFQNLNYSVCTLSLHGNLNVGTIMRTSQLMGVDKYFVFGRRIFDTRSTVGADKYMNMIRILGIKGTNNDDKPVLVSKLSFEDRQLCPQKFNETMIEYNLVPIFIEQTHDAIFDDEINWNLIHSKIPKDKQICFIFGNEGDGIADEILALRKSHQGSIVITIRQLGALQSLNVSAAAAIILSKYKEWKLKKILDKY
ncbi:SpoU rRNA Methylase family [seawater metagenome]|uniref:SpoU rRNA Methylase family n=1 Tax=seawater metagenome TaxID=1561972 RepID=A0A5E8CIY4_9ZZZZ